MQPLDFTQYLTARRIATREYSKYVSQGRNGYLPFLDGVLKNIDIINEVDLGTVETPLEKIKGTYTYLRSISFARNYMPLMDVETEFAGKWQKVCDIQQTEGLRDPIKVYEYLNWFYVIEGNKRVSVLRYLGVDFFPAQIIRLVPKYDENDPDIRLYYEFLEFYKKTGLNEIWFTREKGFAQLWELISDYDPKNSKADADERWRWFVNAVYRSFRRVFLSLGGGDLPLTTGDAMLDFMKVHGVPSEYDPDLLKPQLERFLMEVRLHAAPNAIEVQTTPNLKEEATFLNRLRGRSKADKLKVGFAYANTNKTSSWAYSHELGRMHVKQTLADQVETVAVRGLPETMEAVPMIKELADRGCRVIFTTSPALLTATLKVALEHPNVIFMNCSGWHSFKHVNTYFGRIHEPRFLCGVIAGAMSHSERVGYIATLPVPDVLAGINAFALGVQMVRPGMQVQVEWTNRWDNTTGNPDLLARLHEAGCEFVSHHNTLSNRRLSPEYGLFSLARDEMGLVVPDRYLAAPVWNWGVFYEKMLRSILATGMKTAGDNTVQTPIRNFWWGMDSGLVDLFYTQSLLPTETVKLVELFRSVIISQSFQIFAGPIRDQNGVIRIEAGDIATHEQILSMNWLVQGVETPLPETFNISIVEGLDTGRL